MSQQQDKDFPVPPTYSQTITTTGDWVNVVTKIHYPDGSTAQTIKSISKK